MPVQLEIILTGMDHEKDDSNTYIDGYEVHESDYKLIARELQKGHALVEYDRVYEEHHREDAAD